MKLKIRKTMPFERYLLGLMNHPDYRERKFFWRVVFYLLIIYFNARFLFSGIHSMGMGPTMEWL